jgi:hypothetical protein
MNHSEQFEECVDHDCQWLALVKLSVTMQRFYSRILPPELTGLRGTRDLPDVLVLNWSMSF